jgi:hypothetical protein
VDDFLALLGGEEPCSENDIRKFGSDDNKGDEHDCRFKPGERVFTSGTFISQYIVPLPYLQDYSEIEIA